MARVNKKMREVLLKNNKYNHSQINDTELRTVYHWHIYEHILLLMRTTLKLIDVRH